MKKRMSMLLALCLLMGMTVPASAQDPENPSQGYQVEWKEDANVFLSENVDVTLVVDHRERTDYSAYDLTIQYDAQRLAYVGSNTDATIKNEVTEDGGLLHLLRYGSDLICGEDSIVLTFTGQAMGEALVTLTEASVDHASAAADRDMPLTNIVDDTVAIQVGGYRVELSEDFTGSDTVNPGEDYTFTAKDKDYTYEIQATVNGEPVEVIDKGDGSYVIEKVNGRLVITDTKTKKPGKDDTGDKTDPDDKGNTGDQSDNKDQGDTGNKSNTGNQGTTGNTGNKTGANNIGSKGSTSGKVTNNPATGDETDFFLWGACLLLAGILICLAGRRRREN